MVGYVKWDFVADVLNGVFEDWVSSVVFEDDGGLAVPVGVKATNFRSDDVVWIYFDDANGGWVVVHDGYKFYFRDFLDVIGFVAEGLGGF